MAVSGRIAVLEEPAKSWLSLAAPKVPADKNVLPLNTADVYKDLRLRGYDYGGIFRGITSSDNYGKCNSRQNYFELKYRAVHVYILNANFQSLGIVGKLQWVDNWISFMDTMLQFSILGMPGRELYLPTRVQRINIDPLRHKEAVSNLPEGQNGNDSIIFRTIQKLLGY